MSDLCTCKIEGTVWDEFCQIDDNIVPHSGDKRVNIDYFPGDARKKARCGVTCISSNFIDRYVDNERDGGEYNRRSSMLEKYSLSDTQNSLFPTSSDSNSLSDNAKTSGHDIKNNHTYPIGSDFCANDPIHNEKSTAHHSNSYSYSLGDTPQIDNDLSFFDNFEDVDRMFRCCDSTYGLGTSGEDEFDWFSSPNALEESRDVPDSDLKFSCPESNAMENISDPSNLIVTCAINGSALAASPVVSKESSWPLGRDEFASHLSIVNGPSSSDCKDEFTHRDQIDECKMHLKDQNQSERKRKEQYFGNGSISEMPSEVIQFPERDTSHQAFPSVDLQNQQKSIAQDSCCSHHAFPYADLQNQQKAIGQDSCCSACDSVSLEKQVHLSRDKWDDHCEVEGVRIVNPAELCSSNVQESLSMSLDPDDISPEAVSFRQLQHITEQEALMGKIINTTNILGDVLKKIFNDIHVALSLFDQVLNLRTKLCIRDGLRRLARSAEQRQQLENLNSSSGDQRYASGTFMDEGAKRCTEVMNMEVDRSIAQLLFMCP